jgi:hypothetical protein
MSDTAAHAKPSPRRDHLWVLVVIAACALLEVWASWLGIGAVSGFPKLGRMTTGWILPVSAEAYWGYAAWAWLAGACGPRSRRFAMWSAAAMFALSVAAQESGHLIAAAHWQAPMFAVALVTPIPLLAVALAAVLVHLRQADREEAAEAVRRKADADRLAAIERAEADERTALRRELEALAQRLAHVDTARNDAEGRAAKAEARTAQLERKVAAQTGAKGPRKTSAAKGATGAREDRAEEDVDARTKALDVLSREPGISGAELGVRVGMSKRWGQLHRDELAELSTAFAGDEAGSETEN